MLVLSLWINYPLHNVLVCWWNLQLSNKKYTNKLIKILGRQRGGILFIAHHVFSLHAYSFMLTWAFATPWVEWWLWYEYCEAPELGNMGDCGREPGNTSYSWGPVGSGANWCQNHLCDHHCPCPNLLQTSQEVSLWVLKTKQARRIGQVLWSSMTLSTCLECIAPKPWLRKEHFHVMSYVQNRVPFWCTVLNYSRSYRTSVRSCHWTCSPQIDAELVGKDVKWSLEPR